jgi:hypothetical protein
MASLDPSDLAALRRKLDAAALTGDIGPALEDLALRAEGEIKDRTPVKTGHLRRSIVSDLSESKAKNPSTRVWTDVEYANPVEAWAAMFSEGAAAVLASADSAVDAMVATIEQRWEA